MKAMTPAPEPKEGVVARRPRRKRSPAGRLEDLLDRVSGKGSRERGDRKESNRSGIRVLDIPRNRELFERLVRSDYDYLMRQRFAVGHRNLTDLLPQSVLGRAQNGHGWFTDEWGTCLQFPDATFDRVLTVLEASAPHARGDLVRKRRGDMLRIFSDWILDNLWTPELELVLADGPVFGVELFAGRKVETRAFLIEHLRAFLRRHLPVAGVGCISEIFDGDPPHTPRGCISQAWSVGEIIRLYRLLQEH